jgi:hypothetical protein
LYIHEFGFRKHDSPPQPGGSGSTSAESSSRKGAHPDPAGLRDRALSSYGFQPHYSGNSEGHPNFQKRGWPCWVPVNRGGGSGQGNRGGGRGNRGGGGQGNRGGGVGNREVAVVAATEAAAVSAAT